MPVLLLASLIAVAVSLGFQTTPYRIESLAVKNGKVTLAGTLTRPDTPGLVPAVALISGSGRHDRDEDAFGFKVFATLADHLTRQGIAVYRYDDRGVGQSTGTFATATSEDFAGDALAAVAGLRTLPGIDPKRVGLIGHSEGGHGGRHCRGEIG